MALADELQSQIAAQKETEEARRAHEASMDNRRAKLELIRLAKETLIENGRNKPVGEGDISAEDVINFAERLTAYIET